MVSNQCVFLTSQPSIPLAKSLPLCSQHSVGGIKQKIKSQMLIKAMKKISKATENTGEGFGVLLIIFSVSSSGI